ncbi:MAG: MerR family transcriptional regulator [Propionibacteriales bacterium]|nr:MerR family transcriptional regulator [Propionibacteriales bacterium]
MIFAMPENSLLTVDQLATRVAISVRTVRFYAGRGLIPPPVRRGRIGYYGPDHVARLELVRELQAHGFTLTAIERYMERIPDGASPQDIALHRTLLAPWMPDLPETVSRTELVQRSGRQLSDDDMAFLETMGVVKSTDKPEQYRLAPAHLATAVEFLEVGVPHEAVLASQRVFTEHGHAIAEELTAVFRTMVWPHLRETGESPERIQKMVERFKPLTVQALVIAYEKAVNQTKRNAVEQRSTTPA